MKKLVFLTFVILFTTKTIVAQSNTFEQVETSITIKNLEKQIVIGIENVEYKSFHGNTYMVKSLVAKTNLLPDENGLVSKRAIPYQVFQLDESVLNNILSLYFVSGILYIDYINLTDSRKKTKSYKYSIKAEKFNPVFIEY